MSDEEKKAINLLKSYENKLVYEISEKDKKAVKILLNLIEKQQKEIEELKKPKYLLNAKTGEITTINNSEFISKDKIKAKIEELEKIIEFEKPTYEDVLKYAIEILQSLLEKE